MHPSNLYMPMLRENWQRAKVEDPNLPSTAPEGEEMLETAQPDTNQFKHY